MREDGRDSGCTAPAVDGPARTLDELAAAFPQLPAASLLEALETLTSAGVLARQDHPDGVPAYRMADPSRYGLLGADVVKRPDGDSVPPPRRSP
jgi:hypothetical protein